MNTLNAKELKAKVLQEKANETAGVMAAATVAMQADPKNAEKMAAFLLAVKVYESSELMADAAATEASGNFD